MFGVEIIKWVRINFFNFILGSVDTGRHILNEVSKLIFLMSA